MGIRIKDPAELKRLAAKGMISKEQMTRSVRSLSSQKARRNPGRSVTADIICPLVPQNPADMLYQALVRQYGRWYEGGLMVFELEFSFDERRWRMDMAMPAYRLALELDGWAHHGKQISGFKRDREKALCFERRGWRVIHFSSAQIKHELTEVLQAIADILTHCPYQDAAQYQVMQTHFNRSKYIQTR